MCHNGKSECVKVKDKVKKLQQGWTEGPCIQTNCGPDETLMCNKKGKTECVKNKDVQKKINEGWSVGPCPCDGNTPPVTSRGEIDQLIVETFKLSAAPNPLTSSTRISYELPVDSKVNITLFDPMGRVVSVLVDASRSAGNYNYQLDASKLAAGIYYYKMTAVSATQKFVQGQKLVIIK
jgi:hypothetical protein